MAISTSFGTNTVIVEDGRASIVDANCPKRECLVQKTISKPGEQLICLPHRLWVEIAGNGSGESEMDVDAVTWEGAGTDADAIDIVSR